MVAGTAELISKIGSDIIECHSDGEQPSKPTLFLSKRILVLSKTTRFDYERQKHAELTLQQFRTILKRRGSNYAAMKKKHIQQQVYVNAICKALTDNGIEVKVVSREEYNDEALLWADAVFSAGGDGTFLIAAAKINDQRPVIGFNTDPLGSEGHLCITRKSDQPVRGVIEKLLKGDFSWMWRQRIRVTILKWVEECKDVSEAEDEMCEKSDGLRKARLFRTDSFDPEMPVLALNDVFIGESHAARVSYYDVQVDDGPMLRQKSSGLTVSTGTGSTSWNYNINRVSDQHINDILSIMKTMGVLCVEPNDEMTKEICRRFNEKLIFEPHSSKMSFTVRDPVFNATFPAMAPRGYASRIRVRSRCSDAHLVLDGGVSVPFNYGTEILLEVHREDALRSVMLL
uniref:NAD(+) kinase n=1 Tax=Ascaris lumbricoides TaxID=6252 RepID=A0A9J2Q1V7_ASCLU